MLGSSSVCPLLQGDAERPGAPGVPHLLLLPSQRQQELGEAQRNVLAGTARGLHC